MGSARWRESPRKLLKGPGAAAEEARTAQSWEWEAQGRRLPARTSERLPARGQASSMTQFPPQVGRGALPAGAIMAPHQCSRGGRDGGVDS